MQPEWDHWLERLYNLRRDKRGSHERPHKPVLLLSIIDLLDRGLVSGNAVPLSDELNSTFKRIFAIVRRQDDQPTIQNPFYHLSGDRFWQLVPQPGREPIYREGQASGAPSVRKLREWVRHGRFDAGLWRLLVDDFPRHQLREALIARYFPEERDRLAAFSATSRKVAAADVLRDEPPIRRDTAFRRTVLEIYDYRCAACGVRVIIDHQVSMVEAAHLIPFGVSRDDRPTNGMALCPNHHWAMDHHLIAPFRHRLHKAGVWQINTRRLDERVDGQRELVALADKPVLPPKEKQFYPASESLRWREEHLTSGE